MKKLSIILLALAFALVMTVPALAIHIGSEGTSEGSLGITGKYQFDGQIDDDDNGTKAYYDDDLEVVMRFMTGDIKATIDWEISDRNPLAGHSNDITLIDNYFIEWQATDALKFKAGEYALGFGRKLVLYNEGGSGLTISYALDTVNVALSHHKSSERTDASGDDADSTDNMITVNVMEAGPFTKLNFVYLMSEVESSTVPLVAESSDNYTGVDLALGLGPVGLGFEYGSLGGDVAEGTIMVADIDLADLVGFDLGVHYLVGSDDLDASPFDGGDDYTPLGVFLDQNASDQADVTALWLTVGYAVNDQLSLSGAALVQAENDEYNAGLAYKIADNVLYKASYASFSEGDVAYSGDRTETFHRIQFTF
jgi:hypothetical protein